jgi:CysZ protein
MRYRADVNELGRGARDVVAGFRFLSANRGLWWWVIAPSLVTLVILVAAIWGVAVLASSLVDRIVGELPSWADAWASWLVWLVVIAALGVGAILVFVAVVGVVAGPFNEILSEKVEERLTGQAGPPFRAGAFVKDALIGIVHGLWRLIVALLGFVLVFAIALIPAVGTIGAMILGGWLGARGAAYDCYDAVLSRRDLTYAAKTAYLARHRKRTFGLGLAVAGLLLVPGLNLIALGLGAVGATLAAHELDRAAR